MTEMLLERAMRRENSARPPVWFMRQAGRYHKHYQAIRQIHTFMDICKKPEIACQTTMGPVDDFGFDAAILFSDILFPLEAMGIPLTYEPRPQLGWHVTSHAALDKLKRLESIGDLKFQGEALKAIRKTLGKDKSLIGFVGAPLTLFCFAVEGTHSGGLKESKAGLANGLFQSFSDILLPLLSANMIHQVAAGAEVMALFDTCAGEIDFADYKSLVLPVLSEVLAKFRASCPDTPVIYYSKNTGPAHWELLRDLPIDCIGIDWRQDLCSALRTFGDRFAIQGNIDPHWLLELTPVDLERRLRLEFGKVLDLPSELRRGWICGLGHGVLPKTPEENVHLFIRLQREIFA